MPTAEDSGGSWPQMLDALDYRQVVEGFSDAVVAADERDRVIYINSAAEKLLGWQKHDLLDKPLTTIMPPRMRPLHLAGFRRYLATRTPKIIGKAIRVHALRPDGTEIEIELTLSSFEFHNGKRLFVASIRDLSDRVELERLQLENEYLKWEVKENFGGLVGQSAALRRIVEQIELVAPTEATVLIIGESGTGKELIARAIHDRSSRASRALVKVNCASVPRELFESEFFGHVKGAFTGALHDRVGRFQLADGGTLFLDEVGEVPLDLQSKLLRVLQEGEFERVGEDRTRQVDVRVIAATNRNLMQEVEAGRFREDLYFRLSVFPLEVPPLRERTEDIPILAAHFLKQAASRLHCPAPLLSQENVQELSHYAWPGNIRELQNVIERAVILSRGGTLRFGLSEPASPGAAEPAKPPASASTREELLEQERRRIEEALQKSGGKIYGPGGAAELLGMRPTTLSSRIAALGIKRR